MASKQTTAQSAEATLRVLRSRGRKPATLVGPNGQSVSLTQPVLDSFDQVLDIYAGGVSPVIVSNTGDLSTQDVAQLLGVSRPTVIRLTDNGRLPCTRTGTHRRYKTADVIAYRKQRVIEQQDALQDLVDNAEELGLYDT